MANAHFRAGVVTVVSNASGQVMAFERTDVAGAWQLPQGGIDGRERPVDAAWRELAEETGLTVAEVNMLGEYPEWVVYEWPPGLDRRGNTTRSKPERLGQAQRWFWFEVKRDDVVPRPDGVEFGAWRWYSPEELIAEVVAFRRPGYARVLGAGRAAIVPVEPERTHDPNVMASERNG